MPRIGLCMIVKNEAHVILRCLESAIPLIDSVLIVDTGSTDGTQQIIREFLEKHQLPGNVIDELWENFAVNRSSAMRHLREQQPDTDYGLMLDADNVLIFNSGFDVSRFKHSLTADLIDIQIRTGSAIHYAPILFSNRKPFAYRGVLHEFLEVEPASSRTTAQGFFSNQIQDSARNRNPDKYLDDAKVFEAELTTETDPFLMTRYTFYLAQSYRDAGKDEQALEAYQRRATLGGWNEEIFISHRAAGQLQEKLNHSDAEILHSYLEAWETCPHRAESLHSATRFCLARKKYRQAYLFAKQGLAISQPSGSLFGEPWIYQYGLLDEFIVAAYWSGNYRESLNAAGKLLKHPALPAADRSRVETNARFAAQALKR